METEADLKIVANVYSSANLMQGEMAALLANFVLTQNQNICI